MPNYLTYPAQTMRITQSYDGTTSHLPHMTGSPKEYALDEGGRDGGRGSEAGRLPGRRQGRRRGVGGGVSLVLPPLHPRRRDGAH